MIKEIRYVIYVLHFIWLFGGDDNSVKNIKLSCVSFSILLAWGKVSKIFDDIRQGQKNMYIKKIIPIGNSF